MLRERFGDVARDRPIGPDEPLAVRVVLAVDRHGAVSPLAEIAVEVVAVLPFIGGSAVKSMWTTRMDGVAERPRSAAVTPRHVSAPAATIERAQR